MTRLPLLLSATAFGLSLAAFTLTVADRWRIDRVVEGAGEPLDGRPLPLRPQVMFPALEDPEGRHVNHAIALAHNWSWNPLSGWGREDLNQPSVAVSLESWYRGLGEFNFDMRPPADYTDWRGGRALGLAARYDGTFTILSVGGEPYSPGGTGAQIIGGTTAAPIMTLFESEKGDANALRVQRRDNTASVSLVGGAEPRLAFGLGRRAADEADEGVLRFAGRTRQPILGISGAGADATLIASRPEGESQPRLRLAVDGRMEWGGGAAPGDVSLRRAERGRLAVEGELGVSSLRVGGGTPIQSLHVLTAEMPPAGVAADDAGEVAVAVAGLSPASLIFVNGPEQPRGVTLAGARTDGPGRLVLRFINSTAQPLQASAGTYMLFVVEPGGH
jgi:hypothetical protein